MPAHVKRWRRTLVWLSFAALFTAACSAQPAAPRNGEQHAASIESSRVDALRALFGNHLIFDGHAGGGAVIPARVRIDRFDDAAWKLFTPIGGTWKFHDGRATGKAVGVSQLMCLVPWRTEKLTARGEIDATGVCELNMYDPVADRLTGADGVGKVHFGRMRGESDNDWFDVSTRDRREPPDWDILFPDGTQHVTLALDGKSITGSIRVDEKDHTITRTLEPADPPDVLYVGVAGGVLNTVAIASLEIDGRIDLDAPTTTVLTGMGADFWGDGRDVTLLYNAGGSFRRLLVNGHVVAETTESTRWTDKERKLRETTVKLHRNDIIGVELADADDETALLLVGIDKQTNRPVIATHPLVWDLAPDGYELLWFAKPNQSHTRPRAGSGGYGETLGELRARLGAPFPGMSIAGPAKPHSRVAFRHIVR